MYTVGCCCLAFFTRTKRGGGGGGGGGAGEPGISVSQSYLLFVDFYALLAWNSVFISSGT